MGSSLFAGISGLASAGKQLDVIANNIANVNTVGFRAGKIHFGDILSQSITGGAAAGMQVGRGVEVAGITTQFSPGSFETREMPQILLLTVRVFHSQRWRWRRVLYQGRRISSR